MNGWLALQSRCFMYEELPPSSFQHAFHAALEGGAPYCQLIPTSLPGSGSGPRSTTILSNGHLLPSSTLDSSHCEIIATRCWNPPACKFHHPSLSCFGAHEMNLLPFVMAA